ncbi:transglycosylase SLT domain-containing protein [Aurantibacillus circumpalustris]|uniref:transglycosylase SLT domain-containing protein n=1 Tax=Aurantibacillus circumpalustris TaxID=3036359 RepID=UPI00295A706D|nr:transglycosylase SLT domain-containing protein [Aurantibacillus circumpalustris]
MRIVLLVSVLLFAEVMFSCAVDDSLAKKTNTQASNEKCYKGVVGIMNPLTNCNENYIFDKSIYHLKVDTLPQIKFWRNIMNMPADTAFICVAESRSIVEKVCLKEWNSKSDSAKKYYRDSVRLANNLDTTSRLLLTSGKKFFYDFDRTSLNFDRGIRCFIQNKVDPWYAQAILLIESPNKLQKSNVGAYGPFQLMKDVARMYGLKVNKSIDERSDFERSAYAASSLIKNICVPRARRIIDSLHICNYNEDELWFRLLVMHIYHAGAYNVQKAVFSFCPTEGNMDLIFTLWKTREGRFKGSSQNYSQLVLAAMLEMNERNPALDKELFLNASVEDQLNFSPSKN